MDRKQSPSEALLEFTKSRALNSSSVLIARFQLRLSDDLRGSIFLCREIKSRRKYFDGIKRVSCLDLPLKP